MKRFHINFTPISHGLQRAFLLLSHQEEKIFLKKEVTDMFSGLEWYWWLVIVVVLIVSVPFKVKFMKWWSRRQQEQKKGQRGKWGDDE